MSIRSRRKASLSTFLVFILLLWSVSAYCADVLTKDNDFMDPEAGAWGFIPDYTDMVEGDDVNWIWTKPGLNFTGYKTVAVTEFENLSNETDVMAQDLLTRNMKDGLSRRLGLKVVDKNADITVKGAMVDYFSGNTAARYWVGFGAGEPLVEVEVYIVDNKTKEIISKVRHQAIDSSIESVIAETISDIIGEWSKR
jgi:TolB-like protein